MNRNTHEFRTTRSGIFLFTAFFFLFLTSCGNPRLWGLSRDELFQALGNRDYGFLDEIEISQYERALAFADEAPYCLGLHFARAGKTAEARAMFELGAKKSPEPYRALCTEGLVRTGSAEEKLASVEALLVLSSASGKDGGVADSEFRARLESLAVSLRLELGRYEDVFGDDPEISAIRADVYRKSWREAWAKAKPLLEAYASTGRAPASFSSRPVLSDFGKAALYGSSRPADEAPLFDRLAELARGEGNSDNQYLFTFYAGRLWGRSSPEAAERFAAALPLAASDGDHDGALWYLLDASLARSPEAFLETLARFAPGWKHAPYFDDILEPFIVQQVQKRNWDALMKLRETLPADSDQDIRARLDYLAARSGRYEGSTAVSAYRAAFETDHSSLYYRVLAAEALGENPESGESFLSGVRRKASAASVDSGKAKVLRALVAYRLEEYVYPVASKIYPDCPGDLARELATVLTDKQLYGDAIRIVLMSIHSSDSPITREDLEFIYPRPWHAEVSAAASRFGIPEYVLYALIRSESYFRNDAVSGVGAQGLTQLMKPTAQDIARKLKLESFDLSDPATNITFGAYYLSELASRLDGDMMSALYAYNAGITRVRSWIRDSASGGPDAGLQGDLFLESLPYSETREYGRKVLAAAAVYGYLYYQKSTGQVVRELF